MEKKTSLPRDVIEKVAQHLTRAGLLGALSDEARGYESWRINEAAWPRRRSDQERSGSPVSWTSTRDTTRLGVLVPELVDVVRALLPG